MSLKALTLIAFVFQLASCGFSGGQIPSDHYYRLPEVAADKVKTARFNTLLLNSVKVEGLYHERAILYVEKEAPLEVKRYHYHYWVETPAKLVHKYTQTYLSQSGITNKLTLITNSKPADAEIDITIANFERIVQQEGAQILINLRVAVNYGSATDQSFSRDYSAKINADNNSIHATAAAFGRGLENILSRLLIDLNKNID